MQREALAEALAETNLHGSPFSSYSLDPAWRDVESTIHDMAHLVVLHSSFEGPGVNLENEVHDKLMELSRLERLENERMTLAIELLFLKKQDAFLEDGEKQWLREVTASGNLTMVSVRRKMKTDEAKVYLRRLEQRLQYHAKKAHQKGTSGWTTPRL